MTTAVVRRRYTALVTGAVLLSGCGSLDTLLTATPEARQVFASPTAAATPLDMAALQRFNANAQPATYRLGRGDEITVEVSGRPELSGSHLVGPDGRITLSLVGSLTVAGLTREDASEVITRRWTPYYDDLNVAVRVDRYTSNYLTVLGQVQNPGLVPFVASPTLLEVLSLSGGLAPLDNQARPERAALVRNDQILWVDLERLFDGDLTLNVMLQRGDTLYVPASLESLVYVLGAVSRPGAYQLVNGMSFLDALSQAGGPTIDAHRNRLHVIRPEAEANLVFSVDELLNSTSNRNVTLAAGDIIYVPQSGIAQINYILSRLNPFGSLISIQQLGAQGQ